MCMDVYGFAYDVYMDLYIDGCVWICMDLYGFTYDLYMDLYMELYGLVLIHI